MTAKCCSCVPPLIVLFILIWSYYIYVLAVCVYLINDLSLSCLYVFIYNVVFFMFLWCFLSTMFTPVATVPLEYRLTNEEAELYTRGDEQHGDVILQNIKFKRNLVVETRTSRGFIRYCKVCRQIKPDRAHHCSYCQVCVLKMDHHCGWINNCVGFSNQKSFILLLFYCLLYCLYFLGTTLKYFLLYLPSQEQQYLPVVVGFLIAAFLGMLGGIFFLFHWGLLARNETTLEKIQKLIFVRENVGYNLGCCKNFTEVFGENWRMWPFPVFTTAGNGCTFPIAQRI